MATNTFNSIPHTRSLRRRLHPCMDTTTNNSFFYKPTAAAAAASRSSAACSATPTTTTSQTINGYEDEDVSLELLQQHLSAQNFRQADEETRRLLIALAGEAAVKRGYVFFSEVQFIPEEDLKAIDALWRQHSGGRYGYSVQKRIWKKVNADFTNFFIRVGWMKRLESSEVVQYNYRSFPGEFIWELEEATPEGHLPLTNALRGTQLLTSIFNHPAFRDDDLGQEEGEEDRETTDKRSGVKIAKPLMGTTSFKPNYTF